eukprot:jgi/Ulvmu1/2375/UM130_0008.1
MFTALRLPPAIRHRFSPVAKSLTRASTAAVYSVLPRQSAAAYTMELLSESKCFGGWNRVYKHSSEELGCEMKFAVFLPPASETAAVPAIMYLSGLTCTHENVMTKAGAQGVCAEVRAAFIAPDTSPRGLGIEGEDDSYDFGTGAGFYLDATDPKWKQYRMYSYVTKELPELIKANLAEQVDMSRLALTGHSMGGHGALTIALKNPDTYSSVSAFSPICNPSNCPWGVKAFSGYLGDADREQWKQYDACELLQQYSGRRLPCLVDTGTADNFYKEKQLQPEALQEANSSGALELQSRLHEGYDHSYNFISTFIPEHIRFHAKHLGLLS